MKNDINIDSSAVMLLTWRYYDDIAGKENGGHGNTGFTYKKHRYCSLEA